MRSRTSPEIFAIVILAAATATSSAPQFHPGASPVPGPHSGLPAAPPASSSPPPQLARHRTSGQHPAPDSALDPLSSGADHGVSEAYTCYNCAPSDFVGVAKIPHISPYGRWVRLSEPWTMNLNWSNWTSSVTWTETGLPPGGEWWVNVSGQQFQSSGNQFVTPLTNGSYDYSVGTPLVYTASEPTGFIAVRGKSVNVSVSFAIDPGTLQGVLTPDFATLVVNGTAETVSSNGSYFLDLPPGNDSVVAAAIGYESFTGHVRIGAAANSWLNVSLVPVSNGTPGSRPSNSTSNTPVLVFAVSLLAVLAAAGIWLYSSRKP